jgi:hypothetical protein
MPPKRAILRRLGLGKTVSGVISAKDEATDYLTGALGHHETSCLASFLRTS